MSAARYLLVTLMLAVPIVAAGECPPVDHTHGDWSALLRRFVQEGRVAYADFRTHRSASLDSYLGQLSATCASDYDGWSREQQLAFWINAYNAFTVRLILDNYPIASIRKIGWLPGAAFRQDFIPMSRLKGGVISLDDIEHGTLRKEFREPRIHFALVCAARSCPPLRNEAYRAADLDKQLDDQGRQFLRDRNRNRLDTATNILYLSRIFDWFRADFEAVAESLPAYVARYLDDPRIKQGGLSVEFLDYDWSLNDVSVVDQKHDRDSN